MFVTSRVLPTQITLQKLQKADAKQFDESSKRLRAHHGVVYLPEGTTANNACIHITERQKVATGSAGIWLLQSRPLDAQGNPMDGTDFQNIKDSKHLLSESNEYAALYYTGPDIYLM